MGVTAFSIFVYLYSVGNQRENYVAPPGFSTGGQMVLCFGENCYVYMRCFVRHVTLPLSPLYTICHPSHLLVAINTKTPL